MLSYPEFPKSPKQLHQLTKAEWIVFSWEPIRLIGDENVLYFCIGFRDIAEAQQAEESWKIYQRYFLELQTKAPKTT
jgi:hypothetical protein